MNTFEDMLSRFHTIRERDWYPHRQTDERDTAPQHRPRHEKKTEKTKLLHRLRVWFVWIESNSWLRKAAAKYNFVPWLHNPLSAAFPTSTQPFVFRDCKILSSSTKTRGQSNLTKSASRGAHSPVRGHPRGSKVVPLNSWGRVSY